MKAVTKAEALNGLSEFILSASGWRKVFAKSGNEEDATAEISEVDKWLFYLAATSFCEFLKENQNTKNISVIVLGRDSRPTGTMLEKIAFYALSSVFTVKSVGVVSAPEIMAYAKKRGFAFMYISASHNPVGHNGIKFGLPSGGVIGSDDAKKLIAKFTQKVKTTEPEYFDFLQTVLNYESKKEAFNDYVTFSKEVISGYSEPGLQNTFFDELGNIIKNRENPVTVVCDFNGSARSVSIDKVLFESVGIDFFSINNECGKIVHGIIPEGKNLRFCADEMRRLSTSGKAPVLGYMPDCDGDRGNIIYWDNLKNEPIVLQAQEVFALSVMAELSYIRETEKPLAVAVNAPTSLRIEKIAEAFGAKVFRAEVGEANVVGLADKLREEGYEVRILGEGSNGGNITYPSSVRDPLNTVFAILKILLLDSKSKTSLFKLWCKASGQQKNYKNNFTLSDVMKTLPEYTTTPTQEKRALLKIKTNDHGKLKAMYKSVFEKEWSLKQKELNKKYGICTYKVMATNGVKQIEGLDDFSLSGRGGLKIQFYDKGNAPVGFIWMRGSGTEPVFRVMADIKGDNIEAETELVLWQGKMVAEADELAFASEKN
ncbi:MAG: phosphoglucomutase [Treponema sp.]|nr:MAG: phosphoglucomutase [Treponema sp.]